METREFQAETARVLDLVIHSLYTNREVFLRELLSNASDALDRYRFEALTHPEWLDSDQPLRIHLEVDPEARTLTVRDNGIGMTRDEVIRNIGTIARSGTTEMLERLSKERSSQAPALIGRFGVGFYSAFMVADKVTVITRRADSECALQWESSGNVQYIIGDCDEPRRGTAVTLQLKAADADAGIEDYADRAVLVRTVKRYADFLTYPIVYRSTSVESLDGVSPRAPSSESVVLNSMKPIWTREELEVTAEEYAEFYSHLTHDWSPPMLWMSFKAEGRWEYSALIFVPSEAAHDLHYHTVVFGLQLYSQRMLISEQCQDLLPRYLRFMKGVVDASDLPLNVSRQGLQEARHLTQIRKWLTRRALGTLAKLQDDDRDKYVAFWRQFGRVLKEGPGEDPDNRARLLPLLHFESSADPVKLTTLADYVARMVDGQRDIFYLTGESRIVVERSNHLEGVRARGYEVLYLTDPVDELLVQAVPQFEGHRLRSVAKGRADFGTDEERSQEEPEIARLGEQFSGLLGFLGTHLAARVKSVRLSRRLTVSPACLTREEFDYSPQVERLLLKGKGGGPRQRGILELNPRHSLIESMNLRFESAPRDPLLVALADLLHGCAALAEGAELDDPVAFNSGLIELMTRAVRIEPVPAELLRGAGEADGPMPSSRSGV